uniref:Uncharacterized protein n=1 Tax=Anguilla anguilla TaxID=7936 RepID=A0A0E9XFH5_ANGAN
MGLVLFQRIMLCLL